MTSVEVWKLRSSCECLPQWTGVVKGTAAESVARMCEGKRDVIGLLSFAEGQIRVGYGAARCALGRIYFAITFPAESDAQSWNSQTHGNKGTPGHTKGRNV